MKLINPSVQFEAERPTISLVIVIAWHRWLPIHVFLSLGLLKTLAST